MKKTLYYNFALKTVAWFLFAVFAFLFFLSIAGVDVLVNTGAYWDGGRTFREAAAEQVFSFDKVRIRYVLREYLDGGNIDDTTYREMYEKGKSNVFFTISDSNGNAIVDYGSEDAYQISYKYDELFKSDSVMQSETLKFDTLEEAEKYVFSLEKENYVSYWRYLAEEKELSVTYYNYDAITYTVNAYIRKDLSSQDRYFYTLRAVDFIVSMRYWIVLVAATCAVLCFLALIFLCSTAGRTSASELKLSFLNRIPIDIFWGACAFSAFVLLFILGEASAGDEYEWFTVAVSVMVYTICSVLLASCIVTLAARAKAKAWYKNSVIYRVLVLFKKAFLWIFKGVRFVLKNIPLFWKAFAALALLKLLELACLLAGRELYFLFWIIETAVTGLLIIYILIALKKLQRAAKEMAGGNLDYRAELSAMPQALRDHGENLNNIGEGLKAALEEKMKSEHMKAELITNVSHDIKTPLTSIVNYVDLLKKEGLDSPDAPEYLAVLERQAGKLKKLTEDLIDASKATSGCIAVNADRLDINVLLAQACGEYEDKLCECKLRPILTLAEEEPVVFADGGLIWRVFDNLFNNICKYSQKGTRVYLKTEVREEKVFITFSNISAEQLDISSDELMERFVRGDSSRNTEGSGLGLSIARSLTELQGGSFDIKIDGDLFKAEIVFNLMK